MLMLANLQDTRWNTNSDYGFPLRQKNIRGIESKRSPSRKDMVGVLFSFRKIKGKQISRDSLEIYRRLFRHPVYRL